MEQPLDSTAPSASREGEVRRTRILAKTVYRELRASGLDRREVLAVATELLGLVAAEIREES